MKKTTIYLVRHAEVENPNHVIYNRLPGFDLSSWGIVQAHALKNYFKEKDIKVIYASPLLRTKRTARIIADGKVKVTLSRKFIEINQKKWQGLPEDKRDKKEVALYMKDPEKLKLGESYDHLRKRMISGILKAVRKNKGGRVVIVSHADPIVTARLYFEKKSIKELNKTEVRNASITKLVFNDKLQCVKVEYLKIIKAKKENP